MKLVFLSNYFNHHQKPICEAFHRHLGSDFHFISTSIMGDSRRQLGYGTQELPPYVLLAYESPMARTLAESLIAEADVLIAGSAPEELVQNRIQEGKLVFRYAERPLKKGFSFLKYLPRVLRWNLRNPYWKPVYMLCASAYTAGDYALHGAFLRRCYRWGYFPEAKQHDSSELVAKKDHRAIVWAGRFLDWKRPLDALDIARRLRDDGYDFSLTFIGMGPQEELLRSKIAEYRLQDHVRMPGSMKPEEVRLYMERAGIYLFTSDRQEGWGAVLNESMNSGCAVVASRQIGSAGYLIRDGENGLLYDAGDTDALYRHVKALLDDPERQRLLGLGAYETISTQWNAETAAQRFLELAWHIQTGNKHPDLWPDGPASRDFGPPRNAR